MGEQISCSSKTRATTERANACARPLPLGAIVARRARTHKSKPMNFWPACWPSIHCSSQHHRRQQRLLLHGPSGVRCRCPCMAKGVPGRACRQCKIRRHPTEHNHTISDENALVHTSAAVTPLAPTSPPSPPPPPNSPIGSRFPVKMRARCSFKRLLR